jgi:hypothetical protein
MDLNYLLIHIYLFIFTVNLKYQVYITVKCLHFYIFSYNIFYMLFFFVDAILHYVWNHQKKPHSTLEKYEDLVNLIKLTSRTWNDKVDVYKWLQYITFTLNIDINMLGIKRSRNNLLMHQCTNETSCFFLFYKFQNTLSKIRYAPSSQFYPLIILEYKKKYFVLQQNSNLYPYLINTYTDRTICYEGYIINSSDIRNILFSLPVEYPFAIIIYTAFSFVKTIHRKKIYNSIIGKFINNSGKTLHIFLTPQIESLQFYINLLDVTLDNPHNIDIKSIYSNPHLTESKSCYTLKKQSSDQDILNQNFCVCDHFETQRYFTPPKKAFKSLGLYL